MINKSYSKLSNDELFIQYQEARNNFFRSDLGTEEEKEAENKFRKISREINTRNDFDLAMYKMQSQEKLQIESLIQEQPIQQNKTKSSVKGSNKMKTLRGLIKSAIVTGVITIMTCIPTFADTQPVSQPTQDKIIVDHYTMESGDVKTIYQDNTYVINSEVNIQSIDYIDNSVIIAKDNGESYKFYVDEPRSYYCNEKINITMNQDSKIIDCIVDSQPQVYTTQIDSLQDDTAFLIANSNKYSFENIEGSDGWITGEKCKAVIQDGRLIEVRPIPLAER